MTTEAARRTALERFLRPRSIAVVGISKEPGSLGETQVMNLERFAFPGDLHLVSRNRADVNGRPCVTRVEDLPRGIDAAVVCVPRAGVVETLSALAERGVGGAMVFASGFAEQDDDGRADQARIVALAERTGMVVNGPNCLGLTNFVDGIPYAFGKLEPVAIARDAFAAAVVTQSGATMVNVAHGLRARGVPVAYQISTGNEAVLGIEDHLAFVLDEDRPGPIAMFAEQIRRPQIFLALAERARAAGRHIVLLHPGKSEGARAAALSHTGALAGDHDVMRTIVESAGVLVVDTLELLIDATVVLARFPDPPTRGVAISSDSGAQKSLALDVCEELQLPLAPFGAPTIAAIHESLPSFAVASNPLDLTAQCIYDRMLYERTSHAMLADPEVGSYVAILQAGPNLQWLRENRLFDELRATGKPAVLALPTSDYVWPPDLVAMMIERGIPFISPSTQALRTIAALTAYGRRLAFLAERALAPAVTTRVDASGGALTEVAGKAIFREIGIAVPAGELAHDVAEALEIAARIGYPVVLKAQAAALAHKTDAGGVALHLANEADVRAAWERVVAAVRRARPDVVLDGILVEAMAAGGMELVCGAKRDPQWGVVLVAGLGGIWIEALADVALFAPDASQAQIVAGLRALRAAPLLAGARSAPVDVPAVADVLMKLGALMLANPAIAEIDVNPLVATPHGLLALDALIVTV